MEPIEIKPFIVSAIKEQLMDNYNFELIEDISVHMKKQCIGVSTETFITVKLCDSMCFAPLFEKSTKCYWTCSISLSDNPEDIKKVIQYSLISEMRHDLCKINVFHYPLWYPSKDTLESKEDFNKLSFALFQKDFCSLSKPQRSFVLGCLGCVFISSGDEILKRLEDFMFANKRFPFKHELLHKMYEYAINIKVLTKDHLIKIEELRNNCRKEHSQKCLQQLKDFCRSKKRWFYNTELEMLDCIHHIYRYYRYDWFNEQECQEIDTLFKTYANNESKGELAVNSYLAQLGYNIKKQFTFDDCKDKRKLPFDTMFYIDETLCLIEFDGEQHYNAINCFGGIEHLEYIQRHDKIKDEYCKTHKIPLLRIKYDEIDKIDQLINQFIDSIKIITA